MKNFLLFFLFTIGSFGLILSTGESLADNVAQPCPTEADIILNGDDYLNISGEWDGINFGWVVGTDEIMTAWSHDSCGTDIWADYQADLTQGKWNIGVTNDLIPIQFQGSNSHPIPSF